MSYRNRELMSLVVVAVMTGFGFASVYIARQDVVSADSLSYGVFFLALYLVAHVVTRLTVPSADSYILPLGGLLTAIGVTEIYRIDSQDALRQSLWIVIGLGAFAATLFLFRHDYRRLESYKYVCGIGAVGLLMLPALPGIGERVNGARLWIHVGGLQIQPGEFAKLLLIVFLAGYLREKREVLAQGRLKDLGPLLLIWGAAMLVLLETSDLGSALLYFGIFLAMTYVATGSLKYPIGGGLLFVLGSYAAYETVGRVRERVTIWLHPWTSHFVYCAQTGKADRFRQDCASYQLVKSLYSIGNGHFGGTGFGKGTFTDTSGNALIPYLKTDFIFSALAQELGLIGVAAFLLVYMVFALRGFRTAMIAEDGFSKLLAVGLTFGFVLQTFIIVGGVVRIIPLTGITLPFVSYGGSSIVANFIMLAGLLLVSDRAQRRLG
jgi:cell division protein FtsW (lipid II flippase)